MVYSNELYRPNITRMLNYEPEMANANPRKLVLPLKVFKK